LLESLVFLSRVPFGPQLFGCRVFNVLKIALGPEAYRHVIVIHGTFCIEGEAALFSVEIISPLLLFYY
jgi:hypothetical protein